MDQHGSEARIVALCAVEYRSRQKIADNFLERYNANALSCGEPRLLDNLLKSTPRWESVSSLRRSWPKRRPDTSAPALRRFEAAPYLRSLETIHHFLGAEP